MWRKVPPRFSHEKSDYCPAKIKKLHNPPTPLTPADTQTVSMMTVHSSQCESGGPTVQINTVSHGVSSTCWASRMFLSSVSGRCVHCAEEWSNYGSPVHTQHKINEFTFHSAILSTDDTEKEQNKMHHSDALTCWVLLLLCPSCSVCSTWIRTYSWLVRSIIPPVKGPPTWSFSKALSRKSVRFMAVGRGPSKRNMRICWMCVHVAGRDAGAFLSFRMNM